METLELCHGFYKTKQGSVIPINEEARREVLDRLLLLNHERYEEEVRQEIHEKGKKICKEREKKRDENMDDLFGF